MNESKTLNIENAHIMWPNFAGKETKFNRQGDRNFCVRIDDADTALHLREDGWNIRELYMKDQDGRPVYDEPPVYYMQVKVSYLVTPPKIYMIPGKGKKKILLDEESIDTLDFAEIEYADLIINPYPWNINGKSGIKAYLKTAYVVILKDEFAAKYAEEESPEDDGLPF